MTVGLVTGVTAPLHQPALDREVEYGPNHLRVETYEHCDRYQQEIRSGPAVKKHMADYFNSTEYLQVMENVQRRLGIRSTLGPKQVYTMYNLCRLYRSWQPTLRSPWCAAFTNEDLVVLEYNDDVRHYHKNGYGSQINVNLGVPALQDLYEKFEAASSGRGKKLTAYFTHDTMMEIVVSAMGLFKDDFVLQGGKREPTRLWRTSFLGNFAANVLAVLNRCWTPSEPTHRVQIFFNEKVTELCPQEGCTWQQFQAHFGKFPKTNLSFCSRVYKDPEFLVPENAEVIT